ncbi:unnamed protein product [Arctia plantaginis]|uniref:Uncharacterized protein n=1 Tax=Arctia plantaginis TaxID=874455 RepID=A0A8S0ZAQ0_ARCPL|nr:unnamed protein product [Arctia plantaginis]
MASGKRITSTFNNWLGLLDDDSDSNNKNKSPYSDADVHNDNFNKWKSFEIRHQVGATIDKEAQNVVRIRDIIRFVAEQNLAFRDYREIVKVNDTEKIGNFLGLVQLLGKFPETQRKNVATRSDAGLLLTALQSLSFLALLGLWSPVLREVNDAQLYLQAKGLNVDQCAMKIHALESILVDNLDVLVNDGLDYAKNICEDLGIEIIPRRTRKIKKHGC